MYTKPIANTQNVTVGTGGTDTISLSAAPGMATMVRLLHNGAGLMFVRFNDIGAATNVSITNGIPLAPNIETWLTKPAGATAIYAVLAAGSATLYVTECI